MLSGYEQQGDGAAPIGVGAIWNPLEVAREACNRKMQQANAVLFLIQTVERRFKEDPGYRPEFTQRVGELLLGLTY